MMKGTPSGTTIQYSRGSNSSSNGGAPSTPAGNGLLSAGGFSKQLLISGGNMQSIGLGSQENHPPSLHSQPQYASTPTSYGSFAFNN